MWITYSADKYFNIYLLFAFDQIFLLLFFIVYLLVSEVLVNLSFYILLLQQRNNAYYNIFLFMLLNWQTGLSINEISNYPVRKTNIALKTPYVVLTSVRSCIFVLTRE